MGRMNETVYIWGKQQISAIRVCIPDRSIAEISVPVGEGLGSHSLKFHLVFEPGEVGVKQSSSWRNVEGVVEFTFVGWALSQSTFAEPFRIGDIGGAGLFVHCVHARVGTMNVVDWFVLTGGQ